MKEYNPQESKLSYFLPWVAMVEEGIIINKNGSIQSTLKYRGHDLSSATKNELMIMTQRINNVMLKMSKGWTIHIETTRRKTDFYQKLKVNESNIAGRLMEKEREKQFKSGNNFKSEYFLTLVYIPEKEENKKISNFIIESPDIVSDFFDELTIFKKGFEVVYNNLKDVLFEVKKLNEGETLEYLHSTISAKNHKISIPTVPQFLDSYLSDSYLIGGLKPILGGKHLRIISINSFPFQTYPCLLDRLSKLNIEFRWVSRYMLLDKLEAEKILDTEFRKWFSGRKSLKQMVMEQFTGEPSVRENEDAIMKSSEIEEQKFLVQQELVAQGYYTTTIILKDENLSILEKNIGEIEKILNSLGFTTINETVNCIEAFLGSVPGNLYNNIRKPILNTLNTTHLLPLSTSWTGEEEVNTIYTDGRSVPALLFTETEGKTPFCFNLKIGDVGHSLIVGPTGSGKSTLLNTIALGFSKYKDSQVFIFDKGASSRIATYGVGGSFYDLGAENNELSFQPLKRIDNQEELTFAYQWIKEIYIQDNINLTPSLAEKIYDALKNLSKMDEEHRTLTGFESLVQERELKEGIRPYTLKGALGSIFDSSTENFKGSNFMAFEMETIMKNKQAIIPLLRYVFHRIETDMLQGNPSLIILDECWMFFKNEEFSAKIEEWLRVLRKKKCDVIFATQSPKEIKQSSIYNVILDSCLTKIFLPNTTAKEKDYIELYKEFTLNNKEIDIIQSSIPKREYYYKSPKGAKLFNLALNPITLSYVASNNPEEQKKAIEIQNQAREMKVINKTLYFNKEWLKYKNINMNLE